MTLDLHLLQKRVVELKPKTLATGDWWSDTLVNRVEQCVVIRTGQTYGPRGRQQITCAEVDAVGVGDELDALIRTKWAAAMDGDIRPADRVSVKGRPVTRNDILYKIAAFQDARATYLMDGPTVRSDTFLTNIREELDELDNLLQALDDQQRRENR